MNKWRSHVTSAYNCLMTVSHLLAEDHTAAGLPEEPVVPEVPIDNNGGQAELNYQESVQYFDNFRANMAAFAQAHGLIANPPSITDMIEIDGENGARIVVPLNIDPMNWSMTGNVNSENGDTFSNRSTRPCSPSTQFQQLSLLEHAPNNSSTGESSSSDGSWFNGYPAWVAHALNGQLNNNLAEFGEHVVLLHQDFYVPMFDVANQVGADHPRPASPAEHLPIRREDPAMVHLNAFESPPPSPGREAEDFAFHMEVDPNGAMPAAIPVVMELAVEDVQQPFASNPLASQNGHNGVNGCPLSLCEQFGAWFHTTPENVVDKQRVLKECFRYTSYLLRDALNECPAAKRDAVLDIATDIGLLNNAIGNDTDYDTYQNNKGTTATLVSQIQGAMLALYQ